MRRLRLDTDQREIERVLAAQRRRRRHPAPPSRADFGEAEAARGMRDCGQQRDPLEILVIHWGMFDAQETAVDQALRFAGKNPISDVDAVEPALESRLRPALVPVKPFEYPMRAYPVVLVGVRETIRNGLLRKRRMREAPIRRIEDHGTSEPSHVRA